MSASHFLRIQVWRWSQQRGWQQEGSSLLGHKDWVRDVAWAPNLGLPMNTIASASQDGKVFIWSEDAPGLWEPTPLPDFQARPFSSKLELLNLTVMVRSMYVLFCHFQHWIERCGMQLYRSHFPYSDAIYSREPPLRERYWFLSDT